jgi:predicted transcriptional regulator
MDPMKRLLYWLIDGTRGGKTRAKLILLLLKKPRNTRQLALASGFDYTTVQYHIELLEKNSLLERSGGKYGGVYFVSEIISSNKEYLSAIRGGLDEG